MRADGELVDEVDEQDRVLRVVSRAEMRAGNLLHRSVAVLCRNRVGAVYVHRRTDTKDVWPGLYDMFAGGVVAAGESYDLAAQRELAEELGATGVTLQPRFVHRFESPQSRSHVHVYEVRYDGAITHQPQEVAWGRFCSLDELRDNAAGWAFVPDGTELFARYLSLSPPD